MKTEVQHYGLLQYSENKESKRIFDDFTDLTEEEWDAVNIKMRDLSKDLIMGMIEGKIQKTKVYEMFNEAFPYGSKEREIAIFQTTMRFMDKILDGYLKHNPLAMIMMAFNGKGEFCECKDGECQKGCK